MPGQLSGIVLVACAGAFVHFLGRHCTAQFGRQAVTHKAWGATAHALLGRAPNRSDCRCCKVRWIMDFLRHALCSCCVSIT